MFDKVNITTQLSKLRNKTRTHEDLLIDETKRILNNDLFTEKKILQNLKQYNDSIELITEEEVDQGFLFTTTNIKNVAINYRLKLLESKYYSPEIPYEAILKIKWLNTEYKKELKNFKILSTGDSFGQKISTKGAALFAKTNHDNYYLIHSWGSNLEWSRKLKFLPLRSFENLVTTIILVTLILAISLPTEVITLDRKADYWSGYRAAAFFHLLIFNFGVTVYFTFTFAKNFSNTVWNRHKDFD